LKLKGIFLLLLTIVLFSLNYCLRDYNKHYTHVNEVYPDVMAAAGANRACYTKSFSDELLLNAPNRNVNELVKSLFLFFEMHGSVISNMNSTDSTVAAERKFSNSGIPITFYFVREENIWLLDSIGNLNAMIDKIECATNHQIVSK